MNVSSAELLIRKVRISSHSFKAEKLVPGLFVPAGSENSVLILNRYCIRAISRNWRAVASRNVSTLTPGGASSPDFA